MTFETFVPKKVATRDAALKAIKEQKLLEFNQFVTEFKVKLAAVQGLQVADPIQQLVVAKLQGLKVHMDPIAYPLSIFLLTTAGKLHFAYDWAQDTLECEYYNVWTPFKQLLPTKTSYNALSRLMATSWQVYFGFLPATTQNTYLALTEEIEDHFAA